MSASRKCCERCSGVPNHARWKEIVTERAYFGQLGAQGVALFGEALAFWGQQQAGAIESIEPVFLSPHGGDLNGFLLIRGDAAKLNQVLDTDDYLALQQKAGNLLEGPASYTQYLGMRSAGE